MDETDLKTKVMEALEGGKQRNFLESIELAFNLKDINLSDPKARINEEIPLPHGRGRVVKVAAFCTPEMAIKARDSADLVVQVEEIEELAGDKKEAKRIARQHEFFVAEAPLMPVIGKRLGVFLGPKGKMPKPLPPGSDPSGPIENLRKTVRVRSKDKPTMHVPVGTRSMSPEEITANALAVINRVESKLDRGRMNIRSLYIKTTMGPPVRII